MIRHLNTRSALAVSFLAVQIILPITYYASDRIYDERFAWRMFSSVRMARCEFNLYGKETTGLEPLKLSKKYHVVWLNLAKRARTDVIDALIARECTLHTDVRAHLNCSIPSAPATGICINRADRNNDGIPDGYDRMIGCDLDSPSACFSRDCPTREFEDCYQRLCRQQLMTSDVNRCTQAGVQ
ncbi:MAG: hypothetical protein ACPGQS_05000 [Bradymonadia bacterium]